MSSSLRSKLGVNENIISAKKCEIRSVNDQVACVFLNDSHIKGHVNGFHIGLYYNNELVSILTYGKPRFNKGYDIEILRFCDKLNTTVTGGLSRLLSRIKNKSIISYIDRRYSDGGLYENCGFRLLYKTEPSYYYINNSLHKNHRYNRVQFQKHKLPNILENFDPNLTEYQNMINNGYDRIWDCGNLVYYIY